MTIGALKTIWEVGLDLPKDVSLLAYDDCEWFTALRPMLSTIAQPAEAFADQARSMLMARLNNDRSPKLRAEIPCSLVIRESTARNHLQQTASADKSLPRTKGSGRRSLPASNPRDSAIARELEPSA